MVMLKHLIKIEVNTTSQPKYPNVFRIEEVLKTDNTKNISDDTKEEILILKQDYSQKSHVYMMNK